MSGDFPTDDHSLSLSHRQQLRERLDSLCDRFAAQWESGKSPRLEDYVHAFPESGHSAVLRELLHLELLYRLERGETIPNAEEYKARFPGHIDEVDYIFETAKLMSGDYCIELENAASDIREWRKKAGRGDEGLDSTNLAKYVVGALDGAKQQEMEAKLAAAPELNASVTAVQQVLSDNKWRSKRIS